VDNLWISGYTRDGQFIFYILSRAFRIVEADLQHKLPFHLVSTRIERVDIEGYGSSVFEQYDKQLYSDAARVAKTGRPGASSNSPGFSRNMESGGKR
jgi:hypothetical protein